MPLTVQLAAENAVDVSAELIAVPFASGASFKQEPLASIERGLGIGLSALVANEEFKGEKDQQLDVPLGGKGPIRRLLLLGTGANALGAHLRRRGRP